VSPCRAREAEALADPVEMTFDRAARELFPAGTRVVAAVSGGGDSVALLHLLARLAARGRIEVVVAHLDHALRSGSASDRRFVELLARELGFEIFADRRPVRALRRRDESPEEAARRVRRAFLQEAARGTGAARVALGHTLDDQAETILMRLCRGAGPTALAGMSASGPGPFVRPLLALERDELRAYLRRRGLRFRDDPSNADPRHLRNRVRAEVIPLLAEVVNRGAARHLVEAARRFKDDAAFLDDLARCELARATAARGRVVLDVSRLRKLAAPLSARVLRQAVEKAGADPRRISARHVAALLRLAQGNEPGSLDLPGLKALRRGATLTLRPVKR